MAHLQLIPNGEQVFVDANGEPLALGTVGMYVPNTMTEKDTWQDRDHVALNTNPITLDAAGRCVIWGTGAYRQIVLDHLGNTVWDKITLVVDLDDFAPSNLSFVTIDDDSVSLPNSRRLTAGDGISFADGGAGDTLTISSDLNPTSLALLQQSFMGGL